MNQLAQDSSISSGDRDRLSQEIEFLTDDGLSNTGPSESFIEFWTDPVLRDRAAEYRSLGTSDSYEDLL